MILEVFSNLSNSVIVLGRSREATKAETAARHLQVVPEQPHCSWVSAMGTTYGTGTVRGCCRMPYLCGCR